MYLVKTTPQFKRDLKKYKHNSDVQDRLKEVIGYLKEGGHNAIPAGYMPHKLKGNWSGHWECHLQPDALLIWFEYTKDGEISLNRIGSHSNLF